MYIILKIKTIALPKNEFDIVVERVEKRFWRNQKLLSIGI